MAMQKQQLTVVVRVRPLNSGEKSRKAFQCVFPLDKKRVLLVDPEKFENNILRQNRQHERKFEFDASFGATSNQEDVHETTTGPIIDSVVEGFNATVFAYGATGSGKTFTMIGTKDRPGLMTLMTKTLYEKLDNQYQVLLSYMEIYNEIIRDLLNPSGGDLELLEDERGNIRVPGLSSVKAPNLTRIMQILQEGNLRRTQEATMANKTSSRSHALLQVMIVKNQSLHSKLFMIDLAGSERASNTQNRGIRLKEGAAINRSLLALGNVINSLASKTTKFVNYRDSKLTRLLKDSLGGTAKTCMIAHVTPSSSNFEETYNTLMYASRAMNITNKPMRNRPASADQVYAEAMNAIRKEVGSQIKNSSSITGLAARSSVQERSSSRNRPKSISRNSSLTRAAQPMPIDRGRGGSLFTQLKEQYMTLSDKQKRLREKLMATNQEAYSLEMSLISKNAIINAWEKHHHDKTAESIERLKKDGELQRVRLVELSDQRTKVEKALRKGEENASGLESRMRSLASTNEQREVVKLMVKMAEIEAQKISALSDLAIRGLIMDRTDTSIAKLQKYEMVADKLIDGKLDDNDRKKLEEEYRVIKNQFHYHLLPLKNIQTTVSWNSMLLPKIINNNNTIIIEDRLMSASKKKSEISLPLIANGREKYPTSSAESTTDDDRVNSPVTERLPTI
ncbi:Kinesin-like protein [Caenorhabditis elegans]|uniref:Kinesin-like protein n=1 Tax=Caenorhabditis elegans TaxID=6239 RepID=A0A4V0IKG7_CAEEL|nr:Kinesin-like protein [Caenorhabditis elegans]VTW47562.1 Kinesin-like protein [Caenorhabditis elegans]